MLAFSSLVGNVSSIIVRVASYRHTNVDSLASICEFFSRNVSYFISNSGRIVFEKSRLNGRHALRTKMDKPISLNINRLRFASFSNGDQTVDQVSCTLTKCQP